jgi:hypothetical protein
MRPILVHRADRPLDQLPAKALMESFGMVVRHEFLHHVPHVPFPEQHQLIEALVLDCLYEPLRVRIGVGRRLHLMGTMRVKPFG